MTNPFLQSTPEPEAVPEGYVPAEELFEGICHGGPLDGKEAVSRFPKGFLLVDKPNNHCWIYEWNGNGFEVRNDEPMDVQTTGEKNRFRAAEESNYDVLAAPWGGGNGNASA